MCIRDSYKTCDSCCVHAVRMDTGALDGAQLAVYTPESRPQFRFAE